jgi:hypothetical protein
LKSDTTNPEVRSAWLIFSDAEMKEHGLGYVAGDSIVAFFPPSWFPHFYTLVHQEKRTEVVWQEDDSSTLEIFSVEAQRGDAASRMDPAEFLTAPSR